MSLKKSLKKITKSIMKPLKSVAKAIIPAFFGSGLTALTGLPIGMPKTLLTEESSQAPQQAPQYIQAPSPQIPIQTSVNTGQPFTAFGRNQPFMNFRSDYSNDSNESLNTFKSPIFLILIGMIFFVFLLPVIKKR